MNIMKRAILAKAKACAKRPELREKAIKRNAELRAELDAASEAARADLKLGQSEEANLVGSFVKRWHFLSSKR